MANSIENGWFNVGNTENPPFDRNSEKDYGHFHRPRGQHVYNETNDFRQQQYWQIEFPAGKNFNFFWVPV